jgi:hypothetical protein
MGEKPGEDRRDHAEDQDRPRDPPGAEARLLHDHQLALVRDAVRDVDRGREGRDGCDELDDVGQRQDREFEEDGADSPLAMIWSKRRTARLIQ